jgi:hypothetical protein
MTGFVEQLADAVHDDVEHGLQRYADGRADGFAEASLAALLGAAAAGHAAATAVVVVRLAERALVLGGMPLPGWAEREQLLAALHAAYAAGPPLTTDSLGLLL